MGIDDFIRQFGGLVAIIISILGYISNRRDVKSKQKMDKKTHDVETTDKVQELYKDALDDLEKRFEKKLIEQDKECQETINKARKSIEEYERGKRGELLVKIADLEERNLNLKLQVERLGGFVEGVTGSHIHQWGSKKDKDTPESPSGK